MRYFSSRKLGFVFGLLALPAAWGADAAVVADTYINQTSGTVNFGAAATMNVGGGNSALVQLDLSTLQSLGLQASNIQKATLTVYVKVLVAGGLDFHLTNQSWFESTTTYNNFNLGLIGGTFAANVPVSSTGFLTVDVTNQVRDWATNVVPNNGIIITASTAAPSTTVQLDSKENTATSHAAYLDVTLSSTGPAGPAGATGAPGPAGATGATGPSGAAGSAGAAGATGATGPAGPSGAAGASGPAGPAGATGATGTAGPAGASGASGPAGPAGATGATGVAGPAGATGASGPAGPAGATGATGPAGPAGATGSAGPAGPSGPMGLQGLPGTAGAAGAPGATGPSGPSGPSGTAAAQMFLASWVTPASSADSFAPPSGFGGNVLNTAAERVQMPLAANCTFDAMYVSGFLRAAGGSNYTYRISVAKAGVAQAVSCDIAPITLNTTYTCSDTSHTVAFSAGDTLSVLLHVVSGTGSTPTFDVGVGLHCK